MLYQITGTIKNQPVTHAVVCVCTCVFVYYLSGDRAVCVHLNVQTKTNRSRRSECRTTAPVVLLHVFFRMLSVQTAELNIIEAWRPRVHPVTRAVLAALSRAGNRTHLHQAPDCARVFRKLLSSPVLSQSRAPLRRHPSSVGFRTLADTDTEPVTVAKSDARVPRKLHARQIPSYRVSSSASKKAHGASATVPPSPVRIRRRQLCPDCCVANMHL